MNTVLNFCVICKRCVTVILKLREEVAQMAAIHRIETFKGYDGTILRKLRP